MTFLISEDEALRERMLGMLVNTFAKLEQSQSAERT